MANIMKYMKGVADNIDVKLSMDESENGETREFFSSVMQSNFYFPKNHPHVHIGVKNGAKNVENTSQLRAEIMFISYSFAQQIPTISLYQRARDGNLEYGRFNRDGVDRLIRALESGRLVNDGALYKRAMEIQRFLNLVCGLGVDL